MCMTFVREQRRRGTGENSRVVGVEDGECMHTQWKMKRGRAGGGRQVMATLLMANRGRGGDIGSCPF